ncbi:MAG: RNA methyltransferase [Deltaproteobacteria bacterium RBG_13_53_10]|nr:MAG: RNA methyltransferase [Deltaproteobacteria bacterium RBG_13_53_10]
MVPSRFVRHSLFTLCLSMVATGIFAQAAASAEFEPRVGQEGKDVMWVPTSQELVNKMLDMANVTPQDYVIDLGSGDGRTVITAAKRGARALGIEYEPDMVALSKRNAAREGVTDRTQFVQGDLFQSDFSEATVITMFLLEEINLQLRPLILDLKPGTRVVSNTFTMGEWTADQTVTVEGSKDCMIYCTAYLWIVPAKVEGMWKLPGGEFTLHQNFQKFSGVLRSAANTMPVANGRLSGDLISFSVGDANYSGRVNGSTMQGTLTSGGGTAPWNATRVKVLKEP